MSARRMPAALALDDAAAELLEKIGASVEQLKTDIGQMKTSQAVMQLQLGAPSLDGKGGTGLVGAVIDLNARVAPLVDLKHTLRGLVIGIVVAGAIALFGLPEALKLLGMGAFMLAPVR